ncbi:MAG TPA: YgeY family selenium metabolism-linked hydrolase [Candidatus Cloacimonadota bacterium]|nr:YgeY family selenium metabolism-linked hydrolase [Candidatus Cloacimonadota bacterium]HQL14343.1 YgeY family selenium metabolism-linked hydrolase [Candidatus Cloacimonadota bacterium]
MYRKIMETAKKYEGETTRFLCDMISHPSFSTKEKEVIECIKNEMERVGFDEIRIDGLGNIIGRIGQGKRIIAFDAHIDTVYAGELSLWKTDPFVPVVEDGMVIGRGSVDQEGGMASMLTAARIIKELGFNDKFSVYFTGTVMEEDCDGLCWQYLIQEGKLVPELVVITEPTNLNIYRGHRGRMEILVKVKGLSCHGSAPERGDNAIYKISRIALEIEELNARLKDDPFLGKGTVAVTQIFFSSPSQCAVPDAASIQLDRRLTFGETKESAVKEVQDACLRAGVPDAEIEVLQYAEKAYTGLIYPTEKYYPTWVLPENSPWLKSAAYSYEQVLGKQPFIDKWTFSTNGVAIMGKHHIPCLGLGPGNEVYAHAPNEACPIEHLTQAAAFYAAFVYTLNRE